MTTPAKGEADFLELGDWNAICYDCGRKAKASTLVKTWQGFYVCPHHVDIIRHPQDFVRGIPDIQTPPWSQPQPADTFVQTSYICMEADDQNFIITETTFSPLEMES